MLGVRVVSIIGVTLLALPVVKSLSRPTTPWPVDMGKLPLKAGASGACCVDVSLEMDGTVWLESLDTGGGWLLSCFGDPS